MKKTLFNNKSESFDYAFTQPNVHFQKYGKILYTNLD